MESNQAFARLPASFNENQRLYEQIPIDVANICLETLMQRFDDLTEASSGLNLSKTMLNSPAHTRIFIVSADCPMVLLNIILGGWRSGENIFYCYYGVY